MAASRDLKEKIDVMNCMNLAGWLISESQKLETFPSDGGLGLVSPCSAPKCSSVKWRLEKEHVSNEKYELVRQGPKGSESSFDSLQVNDRLDDAVLDIQAAAFIDSAEGQICQHAVDLLSDVPGPLHTVKDREESEYFPPGWKVKAGNFNLSTRFTHKK